MTHGIRIATIALVTTLAACGGSDAAPDTAAARTPAAASGVQPTGKVITIEMFTDEQGNYFKPKDIEAHRGDLLRFTLGSGVHNVHFLPDSNPGRTGLPAASEFLQLPGQTYDLVVSLPQGKYFFQCDPHALLGMVGTLEVEDEE